MATVTASKAKTMLGEPHLVPSLDDACHFRRRYLNFADNTARLK